MINTNCIHSLNKKNITKILDEIVRELSRGECDCACDRVYIINLVFKFTCMGPRRLILRQLGCKSRPAQHMQHLVHRGQLRQVLRSLAVPEMLDPVAAA